MIVYGDSIEKVLGNEYSLQITKKAKQILLNFQNGDAPDKLEVVDKLINKIDGNKDKEAILITGNQFTEDWFQKLLDAGAIVCFTNHKISFFENGKNKQAACFVYLGVNEKEFVSEFDAYGNCMKKVEV